MRILRRNHYFSKNVCFAEGLHTRRRGGVTRGPCPEHNCSSQYPAVARNSRDPPIPTCKTVFKPTKSQGKLVKAKEKLMKNKEKPIVFL